MSALLLGIESSCDETSLAVVNSRYEVVWHETSSQTDLHAEYGGVVPELASRRHITELFRLLKRLKEKQGHLYKGIDAVAVTVQPGLIGSLLVGVEAAKSLALSHNISLIPVHHLKAHLFAASLEQKLSFPFLGVIVSGGHTLICLVHSYDDFSVIAQSRDDAVGEAYDKVARVLEYGYPGGPVIDRIHQQYSGNYIPFPQPMKKKLDFSLSGLKTAVVRYVLSSNTLGEDEKKRVAASFQETVLNMMLEKVQLAIRKYPVESVAVVGGVSANRGLRRKMQQLSVPVVFPSFEYCTDNAAMVAGLGTWYFLHGLKIMKPGSAGFLKLNASPSPEF